MPRFAPTSSSVRGRTPSSPKRSTTTRRWRGCSLSSASSNSDERALIGRLELRLLRAQVRDQVGDTRVAVADRGLEADRVEDELEQLLHALGGDVELGGDLLERRIAVELLPEQPPCLRHLPNLVRHMDGKADRATLLCECARDGLLDPPRRIGRELEAHRVVELLDGADEAEVPFLDEVEEWDVGACVVPRDRHHEPQVRLDELALRRLVAQVLAPGELALLRRRQEAAVADLADVELQRVVGARPCEPWQLTRRRRLVRDGRRVLVRRIEEMLGCIAFHGWSIGCTVAPLEG